MKEAIGLRKIIRLSMTANRTVDPPFAARIAKCCCLSFALVSLLGAGCASRAVSSSSGGALLSGRYGSIQLPPGIPAQSFGHYAPYERDEFGAQVKNLGKDIGVSVGIGPGRAESFTGLQAALEEEMEGMREVYEDPRVRHVGTAVIAGQSVPIIESVDGTGDDSLRAEVALPNGKITFRILARGYDGVGQHVPYLKSLIEGSTILSR